MKLPPGLPEHLSAIQSLLDDCSADELSLINAYIVERAKERQAQSRAEHMARFKAGDRVSFDSKQGETVEAVVIKTNKQTVSLQCDEGKKWNVSPELLTLINKPVRSQEPTRQLSLASENAPAVAGTPSIGQRREWVGGLIEAPGYVTGESAAPYRPKMFIWINEIAQVVGMSMITPSDPAVDVVQELHHAIDAPLVGSPGAPSHVRVADSAHANQLQAVFPSISVVCAATPELSELESVMERELAPEEDTRTYSETGASQAAIADFFDAAALLYRARAWDIIPHDQCLISVTVEAFGLKNAPLSVIGQAGQHFGIILFDQLADFDRYTALGDAMLKGDDVEIPPHSFLSFDPVQEVAAAMRKDISSHGWKVVDTKSYPLLMAPDNGRTMRPITPRDITLYTALCRVFANALSNLKFKASIAGGSPFRLEQTIQTEDGPVGVVLDVPYPYEAVMRENGSEDSTFARLLAMDQTQEELDWDLHDQLSTELERRYQASPEAQALKGNVSISSLIMSFSFNYLDCTVATLGPRDLEEILYEIIPRKVMLPASSAAEMIADARAFFTFLQRAYQSQKAELCLGVLTDDAIPGLASAMDNPNLFGMGKSMLSENTGFPFNLDDLPPPVPQPSATKPKPKDKKTRKKQRGATKKARKKNR